MLNVTKLLNIAEHGNPYKHTLRKKFSSSQYPSVFMCTLFLGVQALKEMCNVGDDDPPSLVVKAQRILDDYLSTYD